MAACLLKQPTLNSEGWPKRAALSTTATKLEWSTQRTTGHGEEGRTTPPGGRRLRSNPARAQLYAPPGRRVDPKLSRDARSCGADPRAADEQGVNPPGRRGRGSHGVGGLGRKELARTLQHKAARPLPTADSDPGPGAALPREREHRKPQHFWKPRPPGHRPRAPRPAVPT